MTTYAMSVFLLPKGLIRKIQQDMTSFWWNSEDGRQGNRWTAWCNLQKPKSCGGLGFKDLEDFNGAMLGKQAWRIIQKPESLLAQIYKHKYFRRGTFSTARIGASLSLGWRSVLKGREITLVGARWVIKSGSQVRVWAQNWLPTDPSLAPRPLPVAEVDASLTVADLIDPQHCGWRTAVLDSLFVADDVQLIRSLPLGRSQGVDVLRWNYDRSDDYTIKSGYKLRRGHQFGMQQPPPAVHDTQWYNQIRSLSVPPKMRFLLWRVSLNILPTCYNMSTRGIHLDSICLGCGVEVETVRHIFCDCYVARQVWVIFSGVDTSSLNHHLIFSDWMRGLWQIEAVRNRDYGQEISVWICWGLWLARNDMIFTGRRLHFVDIVQNAVRGSAEWRTVQESQMQSGQATDAESDLVALGIPMPVGGVVCSVDGAWKSMDEEMGFGWVFWSTEDELMSLCSGRGGLGFEPIVAEAGAIRGALWALASANYTDVIILSDCKVLIDVLNRCENHVALEPFLDDIRQAVEQFRTCGFHYIPRLLNSDADCLAKTGCVQDDPVFISSFFSVWIVRQCAPFLAQWFGMVCLL